MHNPHRVRGLRAALPAAIGGYTVADRFLRRGKKKGKRCANREPIGWQCQSLAGKLYVRLSLKKIHTAQIIPTDGNVSTLVTHLK
jgi:hypothetical protein